MKAPATRPEPPHAFNALKKKLPSALPPLQDLYVWLATVDEAQVWFEAKNECHCPLALFLRAKFGEPIEVGDDDLSLDGLFLCELPRDYREFVRAFDNAFDALEKITPAATRELCRDNAKDWRITP